MDTVTQETIRENLDYREENRQLKDKISRLEAEIAELKTPDNYYFVERPDIIYSSLEDFMEDEFRLTAIRVGNTKTLPDLFAVKFLISDDGELPTGDEINTFDTEEEAEAFIQEIKDDFAASLKGTDKGADEVEGKV